MPDDEVCSFSVYRNMYAGIRQPSPFPCGLSSVVKQNAVDSLLNPSNIVEVITTTPHKSKFNDG